MVGLIAATLPPDRRPLRIENENEEKKKFRGKGKNPRAGSTCAGRRLPLAEQLCGLEGRQDEEERKDRSLGEGGALLVEKFEREGPPSVARRVGATERGMREE